MTDKPTRVYPRAEQFREAMTNWRAKLAGDEAAWRSRVTGPLEQCVKEAMWAGHDHHVVATVEDQGDCPRYPDAWGPVCDSVVRQLRVLGYEAWHTVGAWSTSVVIRWRPRRSWPRRLWSALTGWIP